MLNISTLFSLPRASSGREDSIAHIELIPYRQEHGGTSSFEGQLSRIFRRIVREGLLQTGLFGSTIQTTQQFINFMHSGHEIFFIRHNGKDAGLFWLEENHQTSVTARFCLYQEFSGKLAADIHQHCLDEVFTLMNSQGVLTQRSIRVVIPSTQKETLHALRRNGIKKAGMVADMGMDYKTNKSIDGILLVKEKQSTRTGMPRTKMKLDWRLVASSFTMVLLDWW